MGPPPDKEMAALGGPQMQYVPGALPNGGAPAKVDAYGQLQDKYSRLKRRYFELEQVSVIPRVSSFHQRIISKITDIFNFKNCSTEI